MHILARNLNLPASFVEIRHAATHEALPSLPVLRTAASRALEWLWSNYWAWIGTSPDEEATVNDEELQERLLSQARLLLKQWRRLRRENPTKTLKYGDASPENKEALGILKECIGMCAMPEGLEVLLDALLEEKGLIPSGKKYVQLTYL